MICDLLVIGFFIFFGFIIYKKIKNYIIFKFNNFIDKKNLYKYTDKEIIPIILKKVIGMV